jgi:ATP-dependent helicase HepA
VAGVVTGDWRRRYILADEVGLGKTIEAGIVIHDLLLQKPDARVLVICPGELAQQWLCEIYSKFGGHIFTLLDLHPVGSVRAGVLRKAIVSTALAGFRLPDVLASVPWDMVVVDEVHQLLNTPRVYALVERLSTSARSLLLLSALPAQRREDEFLRLLRLLEPERYGNEAPDHFRALHAVQTEVGVRLRRLSARAGEFRSGEVTADDVARVGRRLLDVPTLAGDDWLRSRVEALAEQGNATPAATDEIVAYVADRYRINRRILRNRRQHLIERGELAPIERRLLVQPYEPGQLERETSGRVMDVLRSAHDAGLADEVLDALTRVLLQSLVSPAAAVTLLSNLSGDTSSPAAAEEVGYAASLHLAGYAEWPEYRRLLARVAGPFLDRELLSRALERAQAWSASAQGRARLAHAVALLREEPAADAKPPKVLLFAGFPGVCAEVATAISEALGPAAVREFRFDMSREAKEENVRAFATDSAVRVLVSDETGGEGRNFQFVDEIVHYDTPWNVARVEQRIGRLDRIGREAVRPDVMSRVVVAEGSLEAALVQCYADGVGVYGASVSGLEFALREVERRVVGATLAGGYEELCDQVPAIRDALANERSRDEAEAMLDEASFNRAAAERLQQVTQSRGAEEELEHSFVRYLRSISSKRAARAEDDPRYPTGVWTLHPDQFRHGVFPRAGDGQEELFRKVRGTFRRTIAQARPDLEFFAAGHPLFDAVVRSLGESVAGRTYAIGCVTGDRAGWLGFEFAFRVEPSWGAVSEHPGLSSRAAAPFAVPPLHLFFRCDGSFEEGGEALLRTRHGLRMPDEGRTWTNLPAARLLSILRDRVGSDWQGAILVMYEAARERAREHFRARLAHTLTVEDAHIVESLRQIRTRGVPAEDGEVAALECLRAAQQGWSVELDGAGLLVVNAGRA